jgi:protein-S-isoprenylcysteine O-methyltransferase Ste14
MPRRADIPKIRVLPPILVGGSLLIGIMLDWLRPMPLLPWVPARIAGLTVFVLAGLLAHFSQQAMQRAGTNVFPTQPSLALVTDGPFRYSRNPLYIAALGVYLGVALWVNGLVPFLLFLPMFWMLQWGIVVPEETYLATTFGDSYRDYRTRVRRWI